MLTSEIVAQLVEHLQYNVNMGNWNRIDLEILISEWLLDNNLMLKEIKND